MVGQGILHGLFHYSFCAWFVLVSMGSCFFASRSIPIHPPVLFCGGCIGGRCWGWLLFFPFTLIFTLEVWDGMGKVLPGLFYLFISRF